MKNKIFIQTALLFLAGFLIGCDNEEFKEVKITEVNELYLPENNKSVPLSVVSTASVYFEWEKASAEDNGVIYYDVLFDKVDGDFSNPVYVQVADNKGTSTGATITHRVLHRIAGLAGIDIAGTGTLKWTVRASRGLSQTVSAISHTLTITRLNILDVPPALYLGGAATEGGADFNKAMQFIDLDNDEFIVFARLKAGEEFKISDSKAVETANIYYSDGGQLKMGNQALTVEQDGIYCIQLNYLATTVTMRKVNKVEFFMCTPKQRIEMQYIGDGTWKVQNIMPDFKNGGWGDDRYFYYMDIEGTEYKIGTEKEDLSNAPTSLTDPAYNIGFFGTEGDQWRHSFKFPGEMRNADEGTVIVDMTLYLNTKYKNEIVKKY